MKFTADVSKKPNFLGIFFGVLLIFYPLVVYLGLQYAGIQFIAPVLIVFFSIRFFLVNFKSSYFLWCLKLGAFLGIFLAALSWLLKENHWVLYYPVCINLLVLVVFVYSLFSPPSVVEQLARVTEPELPEKGISYCRMVTKVWCVFFVLNGTVSMITCLVNNMMYWTLYNGLISYLLMGTLMCSEWLVRQKVRKRHMP